MRNLTASARSALIKLASTMKSGSPERRVLLATLTREANPLRNRIEQIGKQLWRHLGVQGQIFVSHDRIEVEIPWEGTERDLERALLDFDLRIDLAQILNDYDLVIEFEDLSVRSGLGTLTLLLRAYDSEVDGPF